MKWLSPTTAGLVVALAMASPSASLQKPAHLPEFQGALALNQPQEREISGTISHRWSVQAAEGQYVELIIENKNIDVAITVRRADGGVHRTVNHEGYAGSQIVRWIAMPGVGGDVEVQSIGLGALGRYGITLQALRIATPRDRSMVEADELIQRAGAERAARRDDQAEALLRQALQRVEDLSGAASAETASVLDRLADFYLRIGRISESVALLDRSLVLKQNLFGPDSPEVGLALNNLGFMYTRQGRFLESEKALKRSLDIRGPGLGWGHPRVGITLDNIAANLIELGRYAEAEASAGRALKIFEEALHPRHYYASFALRILATIHQRQGQYAEAVPLLTRALAIDEAELGPNHENIAVTLARLGSIWFLQGRYEEAESSYRRALSINEAGFTFNHPNVASNLWSIARIRSRRGQHAEARAMFHQALAIERKILGRHPLLAFTLTALGQAELAAGTPPSEIMPLVEEAMGLLDEQSIGSPQVRIEAFALRAELFRAQGNLRAALRDLAESIRLVEEVRPQVSGSEQTRALFFDSYARLFSWMVKWQVEAGDIDRAFEYAERRHARVMLDQLAAGQVDLRAGIRPLLRTDLERRETAAKSRIAEFQQRITSTRSRADLTDNKRVDLIRSLEDSLKTADDEYRRIYAELKNASPLWRDQVTAGGQPTSLASVQRELVGQRGLLLLYQIDPSESWLFVVPPAPEAVVALPLAIDQALATALKVAPGSLTSATVEALVAGQDAGVVPWMSTSRGLQRAAGPDRTATLHALWQLLVPAAARQRLLASGEVIIVPDGPLHQLPFEVLVTQMGSRREDTRYWLDDGPIARYAPSATVLYNLAKRAQASNPGPSGPVVLSVSDPIYDPARAREALAAAERTGQPQAFSVASLTPRLRDSYERIGGSLVRLPGTARETAAIMAAYGTEADRSVQVLQQLAADEPATRRALPNKRYVHLATHALVAGNRDALFASLALTPPTGETAEPDADGFLQLHEIYDLKLDDVELAVLSACDTNRGPSVASEGVFALSRGFLASGARRVIASQWSVDDESTAELMGALFTRIVERERAGRIVDYAEALRDAKRLVRSRPQWSDPFHWAPFVLTGRR